MNQVGGARRAIRGFFTPIEEPAQVELEQRGRGPRPAPPRATASSPPPVVRPRAAARPTAAGRRSRATDRDAHSTHQQGPGGSPPGPCCMSRAGPPLGTPTAAAHELAPGARELGLRRSCSAPLAGVPLRAHRAAAARAAERPGGIRRAAVPHERLPRALRAASARLQRRSAPADAASPPRSRSAGAPAASGGARQPTGRRSRGADAASATPPGGSRPGTRRGPRPRWRTGPSCEAVRSSALGGVLPHVVLEQQAADGDQQRDAGDDDQPGVPERQRQAHQSRPRGPAPNGQ